MKTPTSKTFDPFGDRTARDIRNTLSEAFVAAWADTGQDCGQVAAALRRRHTQSVYQRYIDRRMIAYRAATENRRKLSATGLLAEMMLLWNQGLFFEVHELLENHWHEAQGEWREVLKTLIQAAAVYVHREAGRLEAAGKMGRRVSGRLDELRVHLKPIANLDVLRRALENPEGRSPRLEEHRR
jgi:hypothetical protein